MLKVLSTEWYDRFQCIGGLCPLTCCAYWKIALTEREIEGYQNMNHPFQPEIMEAIDIEGKCMELVDGRCAMLTDDDWCKIVRNCGEDILSNTCTVFPRITAEYGDILERTVEIVCPVVAGYLLEPEQMNFDFTEIPQKLTIKEIDYCLYDNLSLARTYLIELLQDNPWKYTMGKLYILVEMLAKIREHLSENQSLEQNFIPELLSYYDRDDVINSVFQFGESITDRYDAKMGIIAYLLEKLQQNDVFTNISLYPVMNDQIIKNFNVWLTDSEQFAIDLANFTAYIRSEYNCFPENYLVYMLFHDWINLDISKFGLKIYVKLAEFAFIQMCAMSIWKEHGAVTKEEYEKVIAGVDRTMTHSSTIAEAITSTLQEKMGSTANWLLLFIC